jgi:hypothetical protein
MQASNATEPREPDARPPGDDYEPPRMRYLALALAVMLAAVGLYALFGGGSGEPERPDATTDLPFVDGTLTVVEPNFLELKAFQPVEGQTQVKFVIRPEDQGNFDIAHLQSHSSVAIPTRIYYRKDGGTLYAVYKEDAPVNSQAP